MSASSVKTVAIVFVLLFVTGFVMAGCKQKAKSTWVNTSSMPGQTFVEHNNAQQAHAVVYLGQEKQQGNQFGPQDVNFDFQNLR
jgi:hypothetical protein